MVVPCHHWVQGEPRCSWASVSVPYWPAVGGQEGPPTPLSPAHQQSWHGRCHVAPSDTCTGGRCSCRTQDSTSNWTQLPARHRTVLVTGHSFLQDTGQYTVLVTGDTTSCRTQDNTLYYELEAHFPAGHRTTPRTWHFLGGHNVMIIIETGDSCPHRTG